MAKSSSWKAYLAVCGVVAFLTLFMLGNVGLPSINQEVKGGQERGSATGEENATSVGQVVEAALEDLRTDLKLFPSEVRAIFREEVNSLFRDEIHRATAALQQAFPLTQGSELNPDSLSRQGFKAESVLKRRDLGRLTNDRFELTAEEKAWAVRPDSFCIGLGGNVTVLTVTPGLETHIDESEMKERGKMSNLGEAYVQKMRRNRILYIKRHGYEYCELQAKTDPTRHASWSKIPITMQILQTSPAVFHMDADAIFVDMKKSIGTMLNEAGASDAELVYTNNYDGDMTDNHSPINAGVYFVRASDWTLSFLERVYTDYPQAVDHEWRERKAIQDFRDEHFEEWDKHARIIPHWRMNSRLDWYKYGDFIAHGAMSPKPWRFQQLLKYMLISDPEGEGWWVSVSLGQYEG